MLRVSNSRESKKEKEEKVKTNQLQTLFFLQYESVLVSHKPIGMIVFRFLKVDFMVGLVRLKQIFNPSKITSKHKHFCCPCPKWADFGYLLKLD